MLIELVNLIISSYLLGLILTIQIVHYPSFSFVDQKVFSLFHNFHTKKISLVVMIPMLVELLFSVALLYQQQTATNLILFLMVLLIWLSTAFFSVPLHNQLSRGKSHKTINKLVSTNWPRTFLWSTRVGLLTYIIYRGI